MIRTSVRTTVVALAVAATSVTGVVGASNAVGHSTAARTPYCGQVWGSLPKSAGDMSRGELYDVRAGRHACFDRLVLDISEPLTGWSVRYVDRVVQDGSGYTVPMAGGARLQVVARVDVVRGDSFFFGPRNLVDVRGYRTFRQVAWVGSFEGVSSVGLGVRARLPFRAFVLPGPGSGSRLVVDVGHRWS